MSFRKYSVVGFSVFIVVLMFLLFSEGSDQAEDMEFTGIVYDVHESSSGFVFRLQTSNGTMRCFSRECPSELGYYGISGSYSEDGTILFIDDMILLDRGM